MRKIVSFCCFATFLLLEIPALGQGYPTGKLTGRVTLNGAPLPGVEVTVASPQLQGERTVVTSETGDYLFPVLPAGEYTVSFSGKGMQTLKEELKIAAAQNQRLDAEMAVTAKFEEEIAVTAGGGAFETISEGAQGATTYTKVLVDQLAAGRTLNQIVALAPGVQPSGPIKLADTSLSTITISGAPTFENLFLVNGVVVNENVRGQAEDLFIEDAIQETTTAASSISAEYGRFSGGVVNVLTKSGGNDFSGSFRTSFTNQKWQKKTPLTTTRLDDTIPIYEATLGGPVVRDRLWFFLAGRDRDVSSSSPFPSLPFTISSVQKRYEGKLTASITPSHTLFGSYQKIDFKQDNGFTGFILDLDSLISFEAPEDAWALNYSGALTDSLLLTAQYAERKLSFVHAGGRSTDLIDGTVILDNSRGQARYNSPTFCGVCRTEERANDNALVKLSYFLSTDSWGTHDLVGGYDTFDDKRTADNHQSGSDYTIAGTSAILRNGQIFPVFNNEGSTVIIYNPILKPSKGTHFVTNSFFANDSWRLDSAWSFNVGLRYDGNDGKNAGGDKVASDSKVSPRLAVVYSPTGAAGWVFHGGYAEYVAAIANTIGDFTSAGGRPANLRWVYRGPAINTDPTAPLLGEDDALRALFQWFDANRASLPFITVAIPGLNQQIRGSLNSPSVTEYSLGFTRRLGSRGTVRADLVHRDWSDFYASRVDTSTGQVTGQFSGVTLRADLRLIANDDRHYERTYDGLQTAFGYRLGDRFDLGGSWTLSKTQGNLDAENGPAGPTVGTLGNYPEYQQARWAAPKGDLLLDQRHRVSLFGVYRVLEHNHHGLSVSLLESFGSGHPYGAVGTVRSAAFVTNPGYLTPPFNVPYFYTARDAFHTPNVYHTDLAVNYELRLGQLDLFLKPEVINVFNHQRVDTTDARFLDTSISTFDTNGACGGSPTGRCLPFNPFTTAPVEGVNWQKGQNFGKGVSPLAFQQPRTFRFAVGLRF
ncbi:MAG TPA: TonB-dependent receptor [Thermoanaerobaculia bacterium]|nr:TonB-dependent receptor [Thermoanaerobaculia bacterium]